MMSDKMTQEDTPWEDVDDDDDVTMAPPPVGEEGLLQVYDEEESELMQEIKESYLKAKR